MAKVADPTGIVKVVAANIRAARKAAELTQEQVALEAEIDRTYVSQVERREKNLTITVLARLAKALGTKPHQLLLPDFRPNLERLRLDKRPGRSRRG